MRPARVVTPLPQGVMVLILFSTLLLCADNPLHDPDTGGAQFIGVADFVFTLAFMAEMVIKIRCAGHAQCPACQCCGGTGGSCARSSHPGPDSERDLTSRPAHVLHLR